MKLNCPYCHRPLLPENINVQTDIALCNGCGQVAKVSSLADMDFDPKATAEPPSGAWYRETGYEQVFGATTRHPIAFFLVPFMCVWSGGSLGGIYGTQIAHGQFNLLTSLFGIPFVLGSVLFGAVALMAVCGKVEVRVRDELGTVFVGVGSLGWTRHFNLDEIEAIEEGLGKSYSRSNQPSTVIVLRGPNQFRFGSNLSDARRYFVLKVLKQLKGKRDSLRRGR